MRYPHTVAVLLKRINERYPDAFRQLETKTDLSAFRRGEYSDEQFPSYLLWMLRELRGFHDAAQAGRWLGWVQRSLEVLTIVTLQENRDLVRVDKRNKHV